MRIVLLFLVVTSLVWAGADTTPFSHEPFDRVLRLYVKDGKVDYEGIRHKDAGTLASYVRSLGSADPSSMTDDQQKAFWLNAYNALVIHSIVEGRSPADPAQREQFFQHKRFRVAGRALTLDEIEHNSLRRLFADPRIHFALVCGADSCPPLPPEAFDGEALDATLDESTKVFLSDPTKVRLDAEHRVLRLSPIFKWYARDFADDTAGLVEFVARYLPQHQARLLAEGDWTVEFVDYDWSLNQVKD